MLIIESFQVFTPVYVMTEGGPHYATLMYVLYLYNNAFGFPIPGMGKNRILNVVFTI
jgi:ABC-type sugar transport system permease subunit